MFKIKVHRDEWWIELEKANAVRFVGAIGHRKPGVVFVFGVGSVLYFEGSEIVAKLQAFDPAENTQPFVDLGSADEVHTTMPGVEASSSGSV